MTTATREPAIGQLLDAAEQQGEQVLARDGLDELRRILAQAISERDQWDKRSGTKFGTALYQHSIEQLEAGIFRAEVRRGLRSGELGFVNSWDETPAVVKRCRAQGHRTTETVVGNCWTRVKCDQCGFTYDVDSSD